MATPASQANKTRPPGARTIFLGALAVPFGLYGAIFGGLVWALGLILASIGTFSPRGVTRRWVLLSFGVGLTLGTADGAAILMSSYFDRHPEHVLGQTGAIHHPPFWPILTVTSGPNPWRTELHQALAHVAATARLDGITREPTEHQPAMGVLAVQHEAKVPHSPQLRAVRAAQPRPGDIRRDGPGANRPSMN